MIAVARIMPVAATGVLVLAPVWVGSSSASVRMPISEGHNRVTLTGAVATHVSLERSLVLEAPGADIADDEDVRSYVSALWAEDWDSPEDQIYDSV